MWIVDVYRQASTCNTSAARMDLAGDNVGLAQCEVPWVHRAGSCASDLLPGFTCGLGWTPSRDGVAAATAADLSTFLTTRQDSYELQHCSRQRCTSEATKFCIFTSAGDYHNVRGWLPTPSWPAGQALRETAVDSHGRSEAEVAAARAARALLEQDHLSVAEVGAAAAAAAQGAGGSSADAMRAAAAAAAQAMESQGASAGETAAAVAAAVRRAGGSQLDVSTAAADAAMSAMVARRASAAAVAEAASKAVVNAGGSAVEAEAARAAALDLQDDAVRIYVVYYGDLGFDVRHPLVQHWNRKGMKFPNLKWWFNMYGGGSGGGSLSGSDGGSGCEYIAVWDDDTIVSHQGDIVRLFSQAKRTRANIFAPTGGSSPQLKSLRPSGRGGVRNVEFIELGTPIFEASFLRSFLRE